MKLFFSIFLSLQTILILFIAIVIISLENIRIVDKTNDTYIFAIGKEYQWPVLGYNRITSNYGKRNSPTEGASSYHYGIDIGAPQGANIVCSIDGIVIFTGFKGAGGNTIIMQKGNMEVIYCHVDSENYPTVGSYYRKGQIIGKVGPKNVYNILNNPYKDSNGNPTNGATTGPHLHFAIRINGKFVNPLSYVCV